MATQVAIRVADGDGHINEDNEAIHSPPGEFGVREGERPNEYIIRQIQADRFFIGCKTEELTLPFALKIVGNKPFIYSSDFPHEVTNQSCKHDIGALLESAELTQEDKEAILYRNAQHFYKL